MPGSKKKIIVAMSGGVDSSVAAGLLAKEGHGVIGVTLKLLPRGGEGFGCCGSPDDVLLAKRSAEKIGIPHYVLDYSPDFKRNVIDYFVNSYLEGETPNPCLACNRHIKFDKLRTFAKSLDATHLATGHYARIIEQTTGHETQYRLFESSDPAKDQSYVLYNLTQGTLAATLFPVGSYPKSHVRAMARDAALPNADKKDSQEICFVPNKDYPSFVKIKIEEERKTKPSTMTPGPITNTAGEIMGQHKGVAYYTIGQRKGLGLNVNQSLYVTHMDPQTNTITVGTDEEGTAEGLRAVDINWLQGSAPGKDFEALVKIRYKHEPTPARIHVESDHMDAWFTSPQRAVTPGQAAVLYKWDDKIKAREVLGGGKISFAFKK